IGNDNVRFFAVYPSGSSGAGAGLSPSTSSCDVTACVAGLLMGDMNHDTEVNAADIPFFAMAMNDPAKYAKQHSSLNGSLFGDTTLLGDFAGPEGIHVDDGKYHGDNRLTFDDMAAFARILGISQSAFVDTMQQQVPEPPARALVFIWPIVFGFRSAH